MCVILYKWKWTISIVFFWMKKKLASKLLAKMNVCYSNGESYKSGLKAVSNGLELSVHRFFCHYWALLLTKWGWIRYIQTKNVQSHFFVLKTSLAKIFMIISGWKKKINVKSQLIDLFLLESQFKKKPWHIWTLNKIMILAPNVNTEWSHRELNRGLDIVLIEFHRNIELYWIIGQDILRHE